MGLLNAFEEFQRERSSFEDELHDLNVGDYDSLGYDGYDSSIEFYGCEDVMRLTPEQQRVVIRAGFLKAYVNHRDGWQTHYSFGKEGQPVRGWRRKSVDGGFLISYWPDAWSNKEWLETGYMKIVPDPLESAA